MKKLNRDELRYMLKDSDRWGCNNQPCLDEIIEALYKLCVTDIGTDHDDEIFFESTKKLSIDEAFDIVQILHPDEFKKIDNNIYKLWWD